MARHRLLLPTRPPGQFRRVCITPVQLVLTFNVLLIILGSLALVYPFAQNQPRAFSHTLARSISLQQTAPAYWPPTTSSLALTPLEHGNLQLPEIALTFDDGPNPIYTPQILAILQRFNIKATFFCIGQLVLKYPTIVSQEDLNGHLVENHTWSHPSLRLLPTSAVFQQVTRGKQAIQQVLGTPPTFFRPPYGEDTPASIGQAKQLDLDTILWDVDTLDWTLPGVDTMVTRVLQETRNGSIILLHDGGGNRSQTVAALPRIVSGLQQRGFRFVTIEQMVDDLP